MAERLPRRGAQIARRLEDAFVHAGQATRTTIATKPIENVMWASTTDSMPSVRMSTWMKNSSSDTPSRISGIATGVSTMKLQQLKS